MMLDLKVMAYFKLSLSTRNWDRAFFFDIPPPNGAISDGPVYVSHVELICPYPTSPSAPIRASSP